MEPERKRDLEEWKAARRAMPDEEILEPAESGAGSHGVDEEQEKLGFWGVAGSDSPGSGAAGRQGEAARLIDLLIEYIRRRHAGTEPAETRGEIDEMTVRSVLRHIRSHPVPAGLLGVSAIWLLLSKGAEADGDGGEPGVSGEKGAGAVDRLEEEIVELVTKGYDHSRRRIGEAVQRHPWAAAGMMVAAGVLAGLFLPERRMPPEDEDELEKGGEDTG